MRARNAWRRVRHVLDLVYVRSVWITIIWLEVRVYSVRQTAISVQTQQYVHNVLKGIT